MYDLAKLSERFDEVPLIPGEFVKFGKVGPLKWTFIFRGVSHANSEQNVS